MSRDRDLLAGKTGVVGASAGLLALCLVASLAVSWWLLSLMDFAYPVWYRVLEIEQTVADHAPLNEYRPGFEATTPDDHRRLFGEILAAVNRGGRGLEAIQYDPAGEADSRSLLREAEIIHLRDVAGLVSLLHWGGGLSLVLLPLLLVLGRRHGFRPVAARWLMAGLGGVLAVGAVVVAAIGPVTVFYAAHEWIFPADHQWFFYYEESLMTMLMQAPNLFLPLGLSWIGLTLVLLASAWVGLNRILRAGCSVGLSHA